MNPLSKATVGKQLNLANKTGSDLNIDVSAVKYLTIIDATFSDSYSAGWQTGLAATDITPARRPRHGSSHR